MVGILADNGSLRDEQGAVVPCGVTTLPHPMAPTLHRLGRSRLSKIRCPLSWVSRRDAVCASAFDGRNSARAQQESAHFGALHGGCRPDWTDDTQRFVALYSRSQSGNVIVF